MYMWSVLVRTACDIEVNGRYEPGRKDNVEETDRFHIQRQIL